MAEKERTRRVVPVGSYVDPNHPEASGGSVNFGHDTFAGVENHPLKHSDDYGATASRVRVEESEPEADDRPEDRSEWKKDDWKAQAAEYGLPVSGNMDELIERVTAHEADQGEE